MTIAIIINGAEDPEQIYAHLDKIREQLNYRFKRIDLNKSFDDFHFSDNNCYGTHDVAVSETDDLGKFDLQRNV